MDTVVVLTKWSEAEMLEHGGSGDWVANKESVAACRYLVATWNGNEQERPHGCGFVIGRWLSVAPRGEDRFLIRFAEFARINKPGAWPGHRNPIAYMQLDALGIDPDVLEWQPVLSVPALEMPEELTPVQLGFKLVSVENIFEPDPIMAMLCILDRQTGAVRPVAPTDYIRNITAINLSDKAPLEVRRAFLLTRNAMCYGYWYYPLFTIVTEQLLRIAEFAAKEAADQYDIKPPKNAKRPLSFADRIDALANIGAITAEHKALWSVVRNFRNHTTHLSSQNIYSPSDALMILARVQTVIDGITWKSEETSNVGTVA